MAEKEERQKRLLIKEYDLVCDLTDCKYCEEKDWCSEKEGMTRQEAIEKMAKAIFNYYTDGIEPQNWELKEVRDDFNKVAEAALDALLGDK